MFILFHFLWKLPSRGLLSTVECIFVSEGFCPAVVMDTWKFLFLFSFLILFPDMSYHFGRTYLLQKLEHTIISRWRANSCLWRNFPSNALTSLLYSDGMVGYQLFVWKSWKDGVYMKHLKCTVLVLRLSMLLLEVRQYFTPCRILSFLYETPVEKRTFV